MLELFGLVLLVIVGCGVLGFFSALLWLRIKMKEVSVVLALEETLAELPAPQLTAVIGQQNHHEDQAVALCSAYRESGAIAFGEYQIEEMDNTCVTAFTLDNPPAYVSIHDHPQLACWTEMTMLPARGGSITITTMSEADGRSSQVANHRIKRVAANSHPVSMIGFARSEMLSQEFLAVDSGAFPAIFAQISQAQHDNLRTRDVDQDWLEEIAKGSGVSLTGDEAEAINSERRQVRSGELVSECLQSYAESSGVSASQWERMRGDLIVVHEKLPPRSLVEVLWQSMDIPEECESDLIRLEYEDAPVRALASEFISSISEDCQVSRIATVTTPVMADIYQINTSSCSQISKAA